MKSAMHPANEIAFNAQLTADPEAGGELHRLSNSELLEHMCALSIAVAYNQSNAAQLSFQLAQQLHGLAVEQDFLKICRLLNACDFTAAQFMLQHLQDQLRI